MNESELPVLVAELWKDLQQPEVIWQVATLAACLGSAALAHRYFERTRKKSAQESYSTAQRLRRGGLRRLVFPLVALALVLIARPILKNWHHVNLLNLAVPLLLSLAAIRLVVYALRHAFTPSGWLATFERFFALAAWSLVALHILGVLPEVIEWLDQITFAVGKQKLSLWLLLHGLVTVLATVLVALWLGGLVEQRLLRTPGIDSNVRVVLTRLSKALLLVVAVLITLPLVGIDLTTLSVFGGALGVGLGFGLQKIASNYVSGFIILLDRSIRLGNLVSVDQHSGVVTQITTRYTVLRGLTGVEAIVPNEMLVGNVVTNQAFSDTRVRAAIPVQVSYSSDIEQAMRIMVEAAQRHPRVLATPPPAAFLAGFADSGINLELGFWIADPEEGTLGLRSDINMEIWREFKRTGIEIPYPQREVRLLGQGAPAPRESRVKT